MSFIAKNPLIIPEIDSPPSVPKTGTRGIFAGKDGWYTIDSTGKKIRIATIDDIKTGGSGGDTINEERLSELEELVSKLLAKSLVKTATVSLPSSAWVKDSDTQYSQIVSIEGITEYSKVDLQPTPEQLAIFHEKDVTFVTENDDGVVTIYCIGQKPLSDYEIQVTITEVEI